jgi:DNA-binding transcriptional MerR regulator
MNGISDPSEQFDFELCLKGRLKMSLARANKWLQIGEFARLAGVSVKTARYYASSELVVPAYVDPGTSYRFYRFDQVTLVRRIRRLRRLGFSIAELQSWLALPDGSSARIDLLGKLKSRIQLQMTCDAERLRAAGLLMEKESQLHASCLAVDPAEAAIPQVAAYTIRHQRRCTQHTIYEMFEAAELHVARRGARANRPPFLMLHDARFGEHHTDVEVCVPILKRSIDTTGGRLIEGAKRAVCGRFSGPYHRATRVFEDMQLWIGSSGVRATAPFREVYWRYGADQNGYTVPKAQLARAPAEYLTEIQIPIAD